VGLHSSISMSEMESGMAVFSLHVTASLYVFPSGILRSCKCTYLEIGMIFQKLNKALSH